METEPFVELVRSAPSRMCRSLVSMPWVLGKDLDGLDVLLAVVVQGGETRDKGGGDGAS